MPIIKDPKMNPHESKYGIIDVDGVLVYYEKENSTDGEIRFMPAGFVISGLTREKLTYNEGSVNWNGLVITTKCTIDMDVVGAAAIADYQPPLAKSLYIWAKVNLVRAIVASDGKWTSDLDLK